jgi:large subunit ribosomal protein L13
VKQEKMTRFISTENASKSWYIVDAKDQVLGRLAAKVAKVIRGKLKPIFTPNADTGDFVIVINADKIQLTGKRPSQKTYFHYSGYPGGAKVQSFSNMINKNPQFVIEHAVKGMLPKNRLGKKLIKKLKVYSGDNHPHQAQKPELLSI